MKAHFRHLAALLALIALTAIAVQGLWASTCPLDMPSAVSTTEVAGPEGSCVHAQPAVTSAANPGQNQGPSHAPDCPLMPMGMTGSCGAVVAVPAESTLTLAASLHEVRFPRMQNEVRDLLLATAFFRPPIA